LLKLNGLSSKSDLFYTIYINIQINGPTLEDRLLTSWDMAGQQHWEFSTAG